jgi:RNase H-fold protein (predicted Holliday junction resolvase)
MSDLLEKAIETARALSRSKQDDIARVVMALAENDDAEIQLTREEETSFAESLAQADRREFATDEQVRAIWAKYGF